MSKIKSRGNGSPATNTRHFRYSVNSPRRADLIIQRVKYFLWRAGTLIAFATVYITVVAEGYRIVIPTMARKIYSLPFLGSLAAYEDAHRIDLAIIMAVILMFSIVFVWEKLLDIFVYQAPERLNPTASEDDARDFSENQFLFAIGVILLLCDGFLFFCGVASLSWGTAFSFTALVATAAYLAVILVIGHVSNRLRRAAYPETN